MGKTFIRTAFAEAVPFFIFLRREGKQLLTEEAKEQRKIYQRVYRAKNPHKFKQYQENYWNRKALENKINQKSNQKKEK